MGLSLSRQSKKAYCIYDLFDAVTNEDFNLTKKFISSGISVDIQREFDGSTALMLAIRIGVSSSFLAKFIDKFKPNLHIVDNLGNTALSEACTREQTDAITILILAGADVFITNENKNTILDQAMRDWNFPVLTGIDNAYIQAASTGNLDVVKTLTSLGVNINTTGSIQSNDIKEGWSPLIVACQQGHFNIVKFLIEKGADINYTCPNNITPLIATCKYGHREVAEFLLNNGAKTDTRCFRWDEGYSPTVETRLSAREFASEHSSMKHMIWNPNFRFIKAVKEGNIDSVKSILKSRCKSQKQLTELLTSKDIFFGKTALMWAIYKNREDIVKLLLHYGADPNIKNKCKTTAFHMATLENKLSILKYLFEISGVDDIHTIYDIIEIAGESQYNEIKDYARQQLKSIKCKHEIIDAIRNENEEIVIEMLRNGIDVNTRDTKNGASLLYWAVYFRSLKMVKLLIARGAIIDNKVTHGNEHRNNTALALAASTGQKRIIKELLSANASPNIYGYNQLTPLMMAVASNHKYCAELLLKNGAYASDISPSGKSALSLALKVKDKDMIQLLKYYLEDKHLERLHILLSDKSPEACFTSVENESPINLPGTLLEISENKSRSDAAPLPPDLKIKGHKRTKTCPL